MSKRDHRLYVEDILESVRAVESYVEGIDFDAFLNDRKTYSATIREYIIIGEAISAIIDLLEERFPDYEWRMVKDFRNFIVHEYFGVDPRIVWDLTIQELPILKEKIELLDQ
ncbi:MAG: DUF86 domain-containing protein [Sulfuricurvum sp.]|uniref:HepT-like ribonuclease domain-containing protein n=1 Tax=Sulfuricurvum sp. TaxID=2025608 RepID=UPI002626BDA8|nr:DUF86 domain-containing protein [Sulfuricurvum sp.]MDD5159577.1 DUF86 domain-containing protein [Sulfuricurvum sp.]